MKLTKNYKFPNWKDDIGVAHMYIKLEDSIITVYHGKSSEVLFRKHAKDGDWAKIWRAIRSK